jgi:hypothetical protein
MLWGNRYPHVVGLPVSSCYGATSIIMLCTYPNPHAMELPVCSCYGVIRILMLRVTRIFNLWNNLILMLWSNRFRHAIELRVFSCYGVTCSLMHENNRYPNSME